MKTIRTMSLMLFFLQLSLAGFSSSVIESDTLNTPEKVIILSHTNNQSGLYYTVMDLANNEMVILVYSYYVNLSNFKLYKVIRTGIYLDPEKQLKLNINGQPGIVN